jgi:hypothetical protein
MIKERIMQRMRYLFTGFMTFLIWTAMTGCQQVDAPTVSYATAGEIDQLLSKAESVKAIGEPIIDRYEHEGGITFVHKQPLLLQGGGIGPVSIERCCTGNCEKRMSGFWGVPDGAGIGAFLG